MSAGAVCLTVIYVLASGAALVSLFTAKHRKRRLVWPLSLNLAAAVVILLLALTRPSTLMSMNPFGVGQQELFLTLVLVLVFALFVEVPGFLLNVAYDKEKEDALQSIAEVLLDVRLSPTDGNRTKLRDLARSREAILEEGRLGKFISKCAAEFVTIGNSDTSLLNTLTEEVRREQRNVSERSKHPFPTLVQLVGLSGFAFVLGEILAILRTR